MRVTAAILLSLACVIAAADAPFPDTPKTHWVYETMAQIKKDRLWYRVNDSVPKRDVPTRFDLATKTLYLALDTKSLIDSLQSTAQMVSVPAGDPQSRKWARQFAAGLPQRKKLYRTHLDRVTKLWHYFRPEIMIVAKSLKVDPKEVGDRLATERKQLDKIHLSGPVALNEGFSDVPPGHWAAKAVNELKAEGILVGYPR